MAKNKTKQALFTAAIIGSTLLGSTYYIVSCENKRNVTQQLHKRSVVQSENLQKAYDLCNRVKDECGSPGLVVSVSVDGVTVLSRGIYTERMTVNVIV